VEFSITYTDNLVSDEFQWLAHVHLSLDSATECDSLSWEAFHAKLDNERQRLPPVSASLPLFKHNANTAAMIRHSLTAIQSAVRKVNPHFIAVVSNAVY